MPVAARLYYYAYMQEAAKAPPLVLIHGSGGNHLYWPPGIRRLSGQCVYSLDLPGHGKSQDVGGHQAIEAYASQVLEWADALNLERGVYIGHSMGGAIAMTLALEAPERVSGLGLVSTGARLRVHPDFLSNAASSTTFHKTVEAVVACSFSSQAPARLVELAAKRMAEVRSSVLYGDLLACNAFDIMDRVAQIRQPTWVICGVDDRMTPLRYSQFLAGAIPHASLDVIHDAGHMVMLEQPQAVEASLAIFLTQLSKMRSEVK